MQRKAGPDSLLAHEGIKHDDWRIKQSRAIVVLRNQLTHQSVKQADSVRQAQEFGRRALADIDDLLSRLTASSYLPRVVRIVESRQDEYGRHFFTGRDDVGGLERLFTPLPLQVGRLYLHFPLTAPTRINPLIFPLEL